MTDTEEEDTCNIINNENMGILANRGQAGFNCSFSMKSEARQVKKRKLKGAGGGPKGLFHFT